MVARWKIFSRPPPLDRRRRTHAHFSSRPPCRPIRATHTRAHTGPRELFIVKSFFFVFFFHARTISASRLPSTLPHNPLPPQSLLARGTSSRTRTGNKIFASLSRLTVREFVHASYTLLRACYTSARVHANIYLSCSDRRLVTIVRIKWAAKL
jgi:hypothetical protein